MSRSAGKSSGLRCRWCLAGACCALALLLAACGAGITTVFEHVFSQQLKVLMPLANGSLSYQGWAKVPSPLTFQLWVWNVTNPAEVIAGRKPRLRDVGPFTFSEGREKSDIEFFPNDTVAFREFQVFHYRPELSVGAMENLTVTSVNMAYATIAYRMRNLTGVIPTLVNNAFKNNGLFTTRTVKEILLGYHDPTLERIRYVRRYLKEFSTFVGLFINRNNSDGGVFLVHTGRGDLTKFNLVEKWNHKTKMDVWPTDEANRILGTDGSMFAPMVTESRRLQIFTTDICRSLEMVYLGRGSVHGIPTMKFGPPESLMLNATLKPSNKAFCNVECLDSGVMDIAKCQHNAPVVISSPHFRNAPTYAAAVEGCQPSSEFDTVIEVEPNTGFVVNAGRKMQMNARIWPSKYFEDTARLNKSLLLPLMWLNESGGIPADAAALFKQHLLAPIQMVAYAQWILIGIGSLLGIGGVLCCSLTARRKRKAERPSAKTAESLKARESVVVDDELLRKLRDEPLKESVI